MEELFCLFSIHLPGVVLNLVQGQLYIKAISFEVMLPSACNFIVDGLTFSCRFSTATTKRKTIYNKAARRRQHNLKNLLNNTVQQDAKI
jgi:hypothetical protein